MVLVEAESDDQHSGVARDTSKLELACRSKFENLDPKPYPNPAEDPWWLCCRDKKSKKQTRKQIKNLQRG
jgi:hypothetical protein